MADFLKRDTEAVEKVIYVDSSEKEEMTYGIGWRHPLKVDIGTYHFNPFLATWDTLPIPNSGLADKIAMDAADLKCSFYSYCNWKPACGCGGFGPGRRFE